MSRAGTEDEEEDEELRIFVASSYIDLLEVNNLPDVLVQTMAWVVGEYGYLAADYDQEVSLPIQPGSVFVFPSLAQSCSVLLSLGNLVLGGA